MSGVAAARGGCLCGGVRYEVRGPLREVIACHCSQCRRTSGHFVAATEALTADLIVTQSSTLRWYRSSGTTERGFCSRCGSNLFWRAVADATASGLHRLPGLQRISIMAGTLQQPTGLKLARHIFVADKSDYYELADGLPQSKRWPDSGR